MVGISDGVLVFGGSTGPPPNGITLTDIWTFTGTAGWSGHAACPAPPWGVGLAYDSQSDRVILFGTFEGTRPAVGETWSFDPTTLVWTPMLPVGGPTNLYSPPMAYDAQSDRVILFGGNNTVGIPGATWAYDYDANAWTEMDPEQKPPERAFSHLAYDAQSDRVILFGGGNDAGDFGDTWAYDHDADTWEEMSPDESPVPMSYASMAYDPATDRMILFGGAPVATDEAPLGDTWAYDYDADSWTLLAPSSAPSARGWHAMAHDPSTGMLVQFGGGPAREQYQNDTWTYDPMTNTWSAVE